MERWLGEPSPNEECWDEEPGGLLLVGEVDCFLIYTPPLTTLLLFPLYGLVEGLKGSGSCGPGSCLIVWRFSLPPLAPGLFELPIWPRLGAPVVPFPLLVTPEVPLGLLLPLLLLLLLGPAPLPTFGLLVWEWAVVPVKFGGAPETPRAPGWGLGEHLIDLATRPRLPGVPVPPVLCWCWDCWRAFALLFLNQTYVNRKNKKRIVFIICRYAIGSWLDNKRGIWNIVCMRFSFHFSFLVFFIYLGWVCV